MKASYSSFAGIDVCKPFLDVHLLPSNLSKRFDNTAAGHGEMIKLLGSHGVQVVVLEATGGYERAAVAAMVLAGLGVHVAQPQVIHAFAVSLKQRAKTDKIDAGICARYAQDRGHELLLIQKIDEAFESLQALVARRVQLVEMQTMEKNRQQQARDPRTLESIERSLKSLGKEIKDVEKDIDATIQADKILSAKSAKLQEIKGVGVQTSRMILGLLPELGEVDPKQLNALVGVAPYAADSGNHQAKRRISGGRVLVRNGLYMACLTAAFKGALKPYYQRLTQQRGLAHKTAMMACIRKLLAHMDTQIRTLMETLEPPKQRPEKTNPSPSQAFQG